MFKQAQMMKNNLLRSSNDKKQSLKKLKWERAIFTGHQMTKKALKELKWQKRMFKEAQMTKKYV